jgi:CheY-like chemotaxis protein
MSPCSVLVIDDDPDVRESLKDAIEASGNFAVITAENGKVALSVIEGGVEPHVILLDLQMPVMDGPTFHAELRSRPRFGTTPVIVVSATANRSDPVIRGSQGFVRKPLHNLDDLITLIQHHC